MPEWRCSWLYQRKKRWQKARASSSEPKHVYFVGQAQHAIRAYLEAQHDDLVPLFPAPRQPLRPTRSKRRALARLSPQSIWCLVKGYAAELGIQATPHHFRHLKASTLLNRGASLSEVQDVLEGDLQSLHPAIPPRRSREVQRHAGRAGRRARGRTGAAAYARRRSSWRSRRCC
jgi:integrase